MLREQKVAWVFADFIHAFGFFQIRVGPSLNEKFTNAGHILERSILKLQTIDMSHRHIRNQSDEQRVKMIDTLQRHFGNKSDEQRVNFTRLVY